MARSVLLIASQRDFTVNVLMQGIAQSGFEVNFSQPDMVVLNDDAPTSFFENFVYYIDDSLEGKEPIFEALCDKVKNRAGANLYLIGFQQELDIVTQFIPKENIRGMFLKPANVQEITSRISSDLKDDIEKGPKRKILIVDDDPVTLRFMKNVLEGSYDVAMANSGMNAMTFLQENKTDLVLLDYEMPVMSGLQTLNMIRADENLREIPVIFLTAKDDKETVMKVLAAKPVRYILKSKSADDILENINDFFKC